VELCYARIGNKTGKLIAPGRAYRHVLSEKSSGIEIGNK
jgi:hypothetical protein